MSVADRRARERQERRSAILSGAEELFVRNGYEKTRMIEIAERCELSKGTLYLYFKNKEEIARAVIIRSYDIHIEVMRRLAAGARTGLETVRALLDSLLTMYRDHYPRFFLSYVLESHLRDYFHGSGWPERRDRINRIRSIGEDALRRGIGDGSVRSDIDPALLAATSLAAAQGFLQRLFLYGNHESDSGHSTEQMVDEFSRILTNSVAARQPRAEVSP